MTGYEAQPRGSPGAGPPPVYISVSGHQKKALFMLVIATPTKTGHQNKKNNKPTIIKNILNIIIKTTNFSLCEKIRPI